MAASPTPRIPDYELIRLIGGGSYGDVWLARGITGAFRAVKIVWRDRFSDPRPFAREFEGITRFAAVSLREPSQLALLHAGRDDALGMFYYVMELADDAERGRAVDPGSYRPLTLREVHATRGRLPAAEVVALGAALARALASLHAAGLVHRDVKPSNVIFVGGVPKLADVGLVTAASTEQVTFVGTEGFVPPEGPGAPAADVFSLGKLLYELATGLDRNDFPRLPPALDTWPDRKAFLELNEVLLRACEGDARRRFAEAGALLDELLLLQAGKSVRRLRNAERRLARALRIAAALAVIAIVAGAGAWGERQRADRETTLRAAAEAERDLLARKAVYSARLTQAQQALEIEEYGRARRFLDECLPTAGQADLRGFEWRALRAEAEGDPARVLSSGRSAGLRVSVAPAGDRVAAHFADGRVEIRTLADGRLLAAADRITSLAGFSREGGWVLGTGPAGRLGRWSATDGSPDPASADGIHVPLGWLDAACALAVRVDAQGRVLDLVAWDFALGRPRWAAALPAGSTAAAFYAATLSDDGTHVALATVQPASGSVGWRVSLFAVSAQNWFWQRDTSHRPTALALEPGRTRLYCGWGDTGEVEAFDWSDSRPLWRTKLGLRQPASLALSGSQLAVAGRATAVELLEVHDGRPAGRRRGLESDGAAVAWLPGAAGLVATGSGGDVRLWPAAGPARTNLLGDFASPPGGGRALCLSDNGAWLAATNGAARGAGVRVVDLHTAADRTTFADAVAPVAFGADSATLWLLTARATLEERELADGQALRASVVLPWPAEIAASAAGAALLAVGERGGRLAVVVPGSGAVLARDSGHGMLWWLALSPDGRHLASGGRDRAVRIRRTDTLEVVAESRPARGAVNGAFSPDGRWLAWAQNDGEATVWEWAGAARHSIVTSSGALQAVTFHPREPRLFLGGRGGTLHVVDTAEWREIGQLNARPRREEQGVLVRAAASADGAWLAGYLEEGAVRLWRAAP